MNVLIVGANTKMAKVFQYFSNPIILSEKKFRFYKEISEFKVLESKNDNLNYFSLFSQVLELRKIIKVNHISIIFTNDKVSMLAAYLACLITDQKVILLATSHNSYAWQNEKKVKIFSKIINLTTDGYISLSSHVTNLLIQNGINSKKIFTTVNPIEQNVFKVKIDYSLNNSISLIYVGVVYKGKGHDILLNAINSLKNDGIVIFVNFYGDIIEKPFYDSLQEYIKFNELEKFVKFHGQIENADLHNILFEHDIYICPSEMEMSPYNIIEAKSTGLPIIASNIGGIPDIISNGIDGLLVDNSSIKSLARAIKLLIINKELRETLGRNAYDSSRTKHSPKLISNNLKTYLSSLNPIFFKNKNFLNSSDNLLP